MNTNLGTGMGDVMGTVVSRRTTLKWMAGAGAAVLAGAVARGASASGGSQYFRTSANLNLRAQPNTSAKILLVIPKNSLVTNLADSSNGFNKVSYKGTVGWASGEFLEDTNGGSGDPDVDFGGVGETTTAVNFRSGPSTSYAVIRVVPKGTHVELSDWTQNGFRYVRLNGTTGWIFDDFIAQSAEGGHSGGVSFRTTAAVNLRAQPSTSARIITVVPKGATVVDYDLVMSGAFRGVDYNGTVGWISNAYLAEI